LISAMLTAYIVDKQLESWKELLENENDETGKEEREEMEQVFGDSRFWDALALRYRARLGLEVPAVNQGERSELVEEEADQGDAKMG